MEKSKNIGWGYVVLGILLAVIGICFISFNNALNVMAITIGIILAVFGIVFGVITLSNRSRSIVFALKIILSVMCIVCGVVTAVVQDGAVKIIADIFCLLLIVDGSFKTQTSILSKRYNVFGWWLMLVLAVAITVSAFLLAKLSPDNTATLTVLTGIIIFLDGVSNFISVFFHYGNERAYEEEILMAGEDIISAIEETGETL